MPRAIDIVRRVAPKARESYILAFQQGDALLKEHGITTPRRLAHFLAQVLHETGGLTVERESGNYRAQRLLEMFGVGNHSAKVRPAEASELAALAPLARKEEAIFERVYGLGNPTKVKDLGNVNPGDGYRYRGGGLLQTTGRGNYRSMGQKCGVDFEAHPELVVSAEHALKPALAEWKEGNLNAAADQDEIVPITRKINGGLNGLSERRRWLARLTPLIKSVTFVDGAEPGTGPTPPPVVSDLAHRVIAAMESKGHHVDRGEGEVNIVYVEGMNPDGTRNADEANKWNDLRLVIRFEGGEPQIVGLWKATTEPGRYYTDNPIDPKKGAARIAFGQYRAWQVGMHHPGKPSGHEALRQSGGEVTVYRDLNKDGERTGDKVYTGTFWINQHRGIGDEVDRSSAGCLVGQGKDGHRDFMELVKSDPRYQADHGHVFATAILPASEVLAAAPGKGQVIPVEPRDDVRRAQKLLGFSEEKQDGILGAITEEAIKSFQRRHGLPVTGDLDETTWDKLEPGGVEPGRGTGAGLLRRAREHIGEKYDHDLVPKDDPNWKGPFDCAEFMSWLVAGILYGCTDDNAKPSQADAYTGGWQTDVGRRGIRVSVDKAAATVGGIVLRYPPPRGMGHIALCDGKGGTVEAKGKKYGVVADTVHGRGWHTGVLVPGIKYDSEPDTPPVKPPDVIYARNAPNMDRAIIIEIQKALASKGFSPGENDGEFGEVTEAAVVDFQESEGLVVDGEVGRDTADALGVSLKSPGPSSPDGPLKKIEKPFEPFGLGVGTMNPFIIIAARLLPAPFQIRSATGQHRRHGGVSGGGKGRGQGL